MKERPFLFSNEMVWAILDGRKTETRRVVKANKEIGGWRDWNNSPPAQPCDLLYVRETWRLTDFLHPSDENYGWIYKASEIGESWEENDETWYWKPSIYMPKEASRIWLEASEVNVERVQDITMESIFNEGVQIPVDQHNKPLLDLTSKYAPVNYLKNGELKKGMLSKKRLAEIHWASLWDSINANRKDKDGNRLPYSWEENPWVWVVKFKILSTTGRPS